MNTPKGPQDPSDKRVPFITDPIDATGAGSGPTPTSDKSVRVKISQAGKGIKTVTLAAGNFTLGRALATAGYGNTSLSIYVNDKPVTDRDYVLSDGDQIMLAGKVTGAAAR